MKLCNGTENSADPPSPEPDWDRLDDGGIRSVQSIRMCYPTGLATDNALYTLLRQYFAVAQRCTSPFLRVRWVCGAPSVTLRWPPLPLIIMGDPIVELHAEQQVISVPIRGGLLAATGTHGVLSIALGREFAELKASVELAGYRPRGDRFMILRWLYRGLQAPLHVHVGRRFLRELCRGYGSSTDPWQARSGRETPAGAPSAGDQCTSTFR